MASYTSDLYRSVNVSSAATTVDSSRLADIASTASRNNSALGLTGLLIFADGSFLEILEGPQDALDLTLERIRHDPRHTRVTRLIYGKAEERLFPDWKIGSMHRPHFMMAKYAIETPSPEAVFERLQTEPALDLTVFVKTFFNTQTSRRSDWR